jgi:hypothetical protein
MAPGTIFVQDGSSISNLNNFGFENTAGSYGSEITCVDVFLEAKDSNCLVDGVMGCNDGICEPFETTVCEAESGETGELLLNNSEGSTDSLNILPIAVASVVAAFVVFGFVGIVARRRMTKKKPSTNIPVERSVPTFSFCCRRKKNDDNNQSADEEMNFDDDDGNF